MTLRNSLWSLVNLQKNDCFTVLEKFRMFGFDFRLGLEPLISTLNSFRINIENLFWNINQSRKIIQVLRFWKTKSILSETSSITLIWVILKIDRFTKTERHNITYEYKRKKEGRKKKENMTIPFFLMSIIYFLNFREGNNHLLIRTYWVLRTWCLMKYL